MLLQLLVRSLEPRAQPRTQKGSCHDCGSSGTRSHLQQEVGIQLSKEKTFAEIFFG